MQPAAPQLTGRGYVNPFEKTLADIESTRRADAQLTQKSVAVRPSSKAAASMDVDSFTRLMMGGGSTTPTGNSTIPTSRNMPPKQDNLSTNGFANNSSQGRLPQEGSSSATAIEPLRNNGKEGISRTGENDGKQRTKPPTPQPRHGKPVVPHTPQVVSFDDFAPAERPIANRQMSRDLPPIPRDRSSSDLSKALPQHNHFPFPSIDGGQPKLETAGSSYFGPTSPSPFTSNQALTPEPNGQSRGTNHLSILTSRARADSNVSDASSTSKSRAPPPPPARRGGTRAASGTSLFPDISTPSSQPDSEKELRHFEPDLNSIQARRPSATSVSSNRSASGSFTNNRTTMPPPPPPTRRRGSGRGILDPVRHSAMASAVGQYDRRGSGGSPRRPSGEMLTDVDEGDTTAQSYGHDATEERKVSTDMLSDLDALQREIDALQDQQRRTTR